jgi:hypothetical protein
MTAKDLQEAEARYQRAYRQSEQLREQRNELVRQALAEGWTHARIAEATGHPRGWVSHQIR